MTTLEKTPGTLPVLGHAAERRNWLVYGPATVIALAFVPIVILFGTELWSRGHYQFFPLVVPGAAALVWLNCRRLGRLEPGSARVSLGLAAAAWLLLALGVALITPWFAAVGLLLGLAGAVYAIGGWRLSKAALPAWVFLWLAIPPPRKYDFYLIAKLQNVVSRWSSELLDLAGVFHVMDGNVVQVAGRELLVDQACSGIYSLFTLLIGTAFYVLWNKLSVVRATVLLVASVFWVLFGNVVRIVLVVVLSTRWGIDVVSGWKHELLGIAMFVVMLGMVVSTDRFTVFVLSVLGKIRGAFEGNREMQTARGEARTGREIAGLDVGGSLRGGRPRQVLSGEPVLAGAEPASEIARLEGNGDEATVVPDIRRTWVGSWGAAALFGVLFAPQLMIPGVSWKDVVLKSDYYVKLFGSMNADSMPKQVGGYQRLDFREDKREWDNSWGEYSRTWVYRGPSRLGVVSLDYHFVEWHDLTICYTSRGWKMGPRWVEMMPLSGAVAGGGEAEKIPVVIAEFYNLEGRNGFLIYGLNDRRGRPLDPPDTVGTIGLLKERLESWVRTGASGGKDGELLSYQLQVFSEGEGSPTPDEREALYELYRKAREQVIKQSPAGGKGKS